MTVSVGEEKQGVFPFLGPQGTEVPKSLPGAERWPRPDRPGEGPGGGWLGVGRAQGC